MPIYKWEGKTAKGGVKKERWKLPARLLFESTFDNRISSQPKSAPRKRDHDFFTLRQEKVNQRSVAIFTRQLPP
jgi:hypothetical protein